MNLKSVLSILLSVQVSHARLNGQVFDKDVDENSVIEYLPLKLDGLNGDMSVSSRTTDGYWVYFYEKSLKAHNANGAPNLIGDVGTEGVKSTARSFKAYVSKIQMYWETIVYDDDFFGDKDRLDWIVGLTVEFSDGSVEEYGRKTFNVEDITLQPGEKIKGDITICETGFGTGIGYYGFETDLGQKFEVGKTSFDGGKRNQYKFDADGHVLTGFFVKHSSTRTLLIGTLVMKEIESVAISNVEYQGFVDNAEVPIWNVDKQVESKISGGNSGTYTVTFEKAKESTHSFTSETTRFMKTTQGTSLSVTVGAEVPEIVSVESTRTTSFEVQRGISVTEVEAESSTEITRVSQKILINFDANRITETTIMQAEYPQTYNWIAKEKYKFKDGTVLVFDTEGTYSGVLVSELEVKTKVTCVDGSEVIFDACPGELGYPGTPGDTVDDNCRFRSFRNILKKMNLTL